MAVNVHMLHVDGRGEGFERGVVKAVERSQQAQVLGNALRQGLRQHVVLNGNRHIVAQQVEGSQFLVVEESVAFAASQRDQPTSLPPTFSGAMHLNSSGATFPFELRKTS